MIAKKKECHGCNTLQYVHKRIEGKPYCKYCALTKSPPKKLNKRSSKKVKEDAEYSLLRKEYLETHELCEIKWPGCKRFSIEIHHTDYRGESYLDVSTWKASCRSCHDEVHANPNLAREKGFLK